MREHDEHLPMQRRDRVLGDEHLSRRDDVVAALAVELDVQVGALVEVLGHDHDAGKPARQRVDARVLEAGICARTPRQAHANERVGEQKGRVHLLLEKEHLGAVKDQIVEVVVATVAVIVDVRRRGGVASASASARCRGCSGAGLDLRRRSLALSIGRRVHGVPEVERERYDDVLARLEDVLGADEAAHRVLADRDQLADVIASSVRVEDGEAHVQIVVVASVLDGLLEQADVNRARLEHGQMVGLHVARALRTEVAAETALVPVEARLADVYRAEVGGKVAERHPEHSLVGRLLSVVVQVVVALTVSMLLLWVVVVVVHTSVLRHFNEKYKQR